MFCGPSEFRNHISLQRVFNNKKIEKSNFTILTFHPKKKSIKVKWREKKKKKLFPEKGKNWPLFLCAVTFCSSSIYFFSFPMSFKRLGFVQCLGKSNPTDTTYFFNFMNPMERISLKSLKFALVSAILTNWIWKIADWSWTPDILKFGITWQLLNYKSIC